MTTIHLTAVAIGLAAMCTAGITAQTQETKSTTKSKADVRGGKDVTLTGCVEKQSNGAYVLTPARDSGHGRLEDSWYTLVTSEDLSRHVGERVQIRGKAETTGERMVSNETKTRTEVANGTTHEGKAEAIGTSGTFALPQLPHLRVRTMKTLSPCS